MSSGRSAAGAKALKQEEAKRAEGGWGGGVGSSTVQVKRESGGAAARRFRSQALELYPKVKGVTESFCLFFRDRVSL